MASAPTRAPLPANEAGVCSPLCPRSRGASGAAPRPKVAETPRSADLPPSLHRLLLLLSPFLFSHLFLYSPHHCLSSRSWALPKKAEDFSLVRAHICHFVPTKWTPNKSGNPCLHWDGGNVWHNLLPSLHFQTYIIYNLISSSLICQSLRNQKSEVGGGEQVIRSGQGGAPHPYSPTRPCLKWSCLQTLARRPSKATKRRRGAFEGQEKPSVGKAVGAKGVEGDSGAILGNPSLAAAWGFAQKLRTRTSGKLLPIPPTALSVNSFTGNFLEILTIRSQSKGVPLLLIFQQRHFRIWGLFVFFSPGSTIPFSFNFLIWKQNALS